MVSRSFKKVAGILVFCLAAATTASAQYGGGTGGMGGTGSGSTGSSGYGSGSGKAVGIGVGVAAGAAVGIALLVHHQHAKAHSEASIVGCTLSGINEVNLKNEKDDQTYTLLLRGTSLQPGQRVELQGVASDDKSGLRTFRVRKVVTNYGSCGSASAANAKSTEPTSVMAQ